ncbi:MAG: hypothetical protein P4L84_13125 [Isosphaeraceae bacterium]|nr:hypothetical protein [Isosphaeraceae bacterium]
MPNATPSTYLQRYLAGDCDRVWYELFLLGKEVHADGTFDDAWAVALETMRRVRANAETVHRRLCEIGYPFANPNRACPTPVDGVSEAIARFEAGVGRLPLSLRAFFEVVGTVDWTQDRTQPLPEAIFALGDLDPLLIVSFDDLLAQYLWERRPRRISPWSRLLPRWFAVPTRTVDKFEFCVSTDEETKGGYGGVGPISILIPDARVDAPVLFEGGQMAFPSEKEIGSHPPEIRLIGPDPFHPSGVVELWTFVTYLRKTFDAGGFLSLLHQQVEPEVQELRGLLNAGLVRF